MKNFSLPVKQIKTKELIINQDYLKVLKKNGLDCFDSIWRYNRGEPVKQIKERSLIRFKIKACGKKYYYLKKHNFESVGFRKLISYFVPGRPCSQGKIEFKNICDFKKYGLATVIPVAAGEKLIRFFKAESFLITEDVSPFISLEYLLKERPGFFMGREGETRKKILLKEIAFLAKKMHKSGFNHRDFNATHILLNYDNPSDIPKLALFDLQRVDKKRFLKYWWTVKTMAGINYTLPANLFDEKDKFFMFLTYKEKKNLGVLDRLQWGLIKRKTAQISRHTKKKSV